MRKRAIATLVAAAAILLTGCANAASTDGRGFTEHQFDKAYCIVYQPYNGSGEGVQMECSFDEGHR